jgi:hypothetical protein
VDYLRKRFDEWERRSEEKEVFAMRVGEEGFVYS